MTFGERVQYVRKMNGLTQRDFGKPMNFSASAICYIENGNAYRTNRTAELIASEYGISKEWLLYETGDMKSNVEVEEALADKLKQTPLLYETTKIASTHMTKTDWEKANKFIRKLEV